MSEWVKVSFAADCDQDGYCSECKAMYEECECPGPTMDEYEYKLIKGVLYARLREEA